MDAVPSPRQTRTTAVLAAVAVACVIGLFTVEPGSTAYSIMRGVAGGVSFLVAGLAVIRTATTSSWPGVRSLGIALLVVGMGAAAFAVLGVASDEAFQPRLADVVMLVFLVPFVMVGRAEFAVHFDMRLAREVTADVTLLALSLAAIALVVIVPTDASLEAAVSAATFALLGATIIAIFGAIVLWAPSRAHVLEFIGFSVLALASVRFGAAWASGDAQHAPMWISVAYVLGPLGLAWVFLFVPHGADRVEGSNRIVKPLLTSITVFTACAALAIVAILDDARGIAGSQSTVILLLLGVGIAARIWISQQASADAFGRARGALEQQKTALRDTDRALGRVRDANESLRQSEEHLRLVFEAAVDGFVELDEAGHVLRANDAFGRMVALDPLAIVGMPWAGLAAGIDGADPMFAGLAYGGQATITRSDGETLHVESTASSIPSTPPRTLLLVRDVTAAKVADQTIRSLFHFLQDRDEDRTRLLRRSNAAIEQERNRIARDLHDGPVQGVSAASLSLEAALLMIKAGDVERGTEILVKIRQELAGEADALRQLMAGLRPPVLEERGLMPALRETVARFETDTGIIASFEGDVKRAVPRDVETLAYRVVQESLTNIGKHAQATTVTVLLDTDGNQLRVEVEDDGRGFETAKTRDYLRSGRVGLASMRERVELASGTFNVRSSPGRGTAVTALIPLDESLLVAPAI